MREDEAERHDKALLQIVIYCGHEADEDSWRAMVYPDKTVYAVEAVRQLRLDYDEAIRSG